MKDGGQMALVHCKVWYREPVTEREESEFDIPSTFWIYHNIQFLCGFMLNCAVHFTVPVSHDPNVPTLEPAPPKKFVSFPVIFRTA